MGDPSGRCVDWHIHPWHYYFDLLFFTAPEGGPAWTEAAIGGLALIGLAVAFSRSGRSWNEQRCVALLGIYANNGQQCLAGSRILVERPIAEEFIARFVERTRRIRIGDPIREDTEIGPLCFKAHMVRVLGYVDVGLSWQ